MSAESAPGPARHLVRQQGRVSRAERERLIGQRGHVLWLTGLSGAGKSTLAYALEARLHALGRQAVVLDGDNLRHGLCADLGFSLADRHENLRRVAEVARLLVDAGQLCIAAFISPLRADRAMARAIIGPADFSEVYLDCALPVCEARDVKGLYRRARNGEIPDFTGISSPYEAPQQPDLQLATGRDPLSTCLDQLFAHLTEAAILPGTTQAPAG